MDPIVFSIIVTILGIIIFASFIISIYTLTINPVYEGTNKGDQGPTGEPGPKGLTGPVGNNATPRTVRQFIKANTLNNSGTPFGYEKFQTSNIPSLYFDDVQIEGSPKNHRQEDEEYLISNYNAAYTDVDYAILCSKTEAGQCSGDGYNHSTFQANIISTYTTPYGCFLTGSLNAAIGDINSFHQRECLLYGGNLPIHTVFANTSSEYKRPNVKRCITSDNCATETIFNPWENFNKY